MRSNRLATYAKRAALCFVFVCEMWTSASSAGPNGPKLTLCPSPEITIFSCQTKKQEVLSICLSPDAKFTVLSRQKAGPLQSQEVTSAEEAVSGTNPRGANVVLQLEGASRTTRLFASLDPYDMEPAIFAIGDGPKSKRICVFDRQVLQPGIIRQNGVATEVLLVTLEQSGLVTHLVNPPSWPHTP